MTGRECNRPPERIKKELVIASQEGPAAPWEDSPVLQNLLSLH